MNQQEYKQTISEMTIPASKILTWVNIIKQEYNNERNQINQNLFERALAATEELVDLIQKLQLEERIEKSEVFTHILGGPIMTVRDSTKLILMQYGKPEEERSEREIELTRYINKIQSAAEYLSSLDGDAVLRILLDQLQDED